jgi:hypothetical protein
VDGRIEFIQSKMLLPTYDVFDEMRNFAPARSQKLFSVSAATANGSDHLRRRLERQDLLAQAAYTALIPLRN